MWLFLTGGVAFAGTASVAAMVGHYPLLATSSALAATTMWYHTSHSQAAFWADQTALFTFAGVGMWEAYTRGVIPLAIGFAGGTYCVLVYYGGRQWKRWVFSPDVVEEFVCHASMHVVAAFLSLVIILLFLE